MSTESEEEIRNLARFLEAKAAEIYGVKMAVFMIFSPFEAEKGAISDFVSNCDRETGIKLLRETADRIEANQVIPATKGSA